jgi:amidohydrolase
MGLFIFVFGLISTQAFALSSDQLIKSTEANYQEIYEHLHMYPELSEQEKETSELVASHLEALGYEVTRKVGGYGVVSVLRNGNGPTIMIRADMDALPIPKEETGLSYASKVPGVMHACGHDMHTTIMLGAANALIKTRDRWHGTVVLVAQPAEEVVKGAQAMLNDGLYTRFPKPDYGIALHLMGREKKGHIYYHTGYSYAANDFFDVTQYGKGTHGANPQAGIDPLDLFVQFKQYLNYLISREFSPLDPVVASIGKVEAGTKNNIIPDFVKSYGIIRYYDAAIGEKLRLRIEQGVKGISAMANAPEPLVSFHSHTDPVYNDPNLSGRLIAAFESVFGKENVAETTPNMGSEDFAFYGPVGGFPTVIFFIGTSEKLPAEFVNHSSKYAPPFDPTYSLGARAMVEAVYNLTR